MHYQPLPLDEETAAFIAPLAAAVQDAQARLALAIQGVALGLKLEPERVIGVLQQPDGVLALAVGPRQPLGAEVSPHDAGELIAARNGPS